MEQGNRKLTLDQPASYQIIVPGVLDESWSDLGEGVTIAIDCETGQFPVTIITGILDQAALHGLLRQLYSMGLPLVSAVCLDFSPDNHPVASTAGRYD